MTDTCTTRAIRCFSGHAVRVVVSRDGMVITAWRTPRRNPKRRIQKSQSRKRREKRRFHVREAR